MWCISVILLSLSLKHFLHKMVLCGGIRCLPVKQITNVFYVISLNKLLGQSFCDTHVTSPQWPLLPWLSFKTIKYTHANCFEYPNLIIPHRHLWTEIWFGTTSKICHQTIQFKNAQNRNKFEYQSYGHCVHIQRAKFWFEIILSKVVIRFIMLDPGPQRYKWVWKTWSCQKYWI